MLDKDKVRFTAREVFEAAILLENTIKTLYINLSHVLKDHREREIFGNLAADEERHEEYLKRSLADLSHTIVTQHLQDHILTLKNHFHDKYLTRDLLAERLKHLDNVEAVFELALEIELDHILYYQEISHLVIEEEQQFIQDILRDERSHFVKLMQYMKSTDF